jgi:hypothetical protein
VIPYGMVKTRNSKVKNRQHRDCPICDPSRPNTPKARQAGKKEIREILETIDSEEEDI